MIHLRLSITALLAATASCGIAFSALGGIHARDRPGEPKP
jgi:hypothetical protein